MAPRGGVTVHYNELLMTQVRDTTFAVIQEVFENEIKGMAAELSPVDTGLNARSITTETEILDNGNIRAKIFTTSGYGGFLELGHRVRLAASALSGVGAKAMAWVRGGFGDFVQGRPYIFPAVQQGIPIIKRLIKSRLKEGGK